jgi:hypothetical protein
MPDARLQIGTDELAAALESAGLTTVTSAGAEVHGRTMAALLRAALHRRGFVIVAVESTAADRDRLKFERFPHCRPGWLGDFQPWPCCRCSRDVDYDSPHVCIGAERPSRAAAGG